MLDRDILQSRGFKNATDARGKPGFQFVIRNPNYRGVPASLFDGIDVFLNGMHFPANTNLYTLNGNTLTLEEIRASELLRWGLEDTLTVFVPKDNGLHAGVHPIEFTVFIRRPYFPPAVSRSAFKHAGKGVVVDSKPDNDIKLGVSSYSYTGDLYTLMTLQDLMADCQDIGATGLELLAEANLPGYPHIDENWIEHWQSLLHQYQLTPTNLGTWVDTARWLKRDLTAAEGAEQIKQDIRIAAKLGFSSIRPKFGVTSFELDPHPIWQEAAERALDTAAQYNVMICPEIHSPTPINHPVTQGYIDFIERTKTDHFRLMLDTGIFQTAPVDDGHEGIEMTDGKRPPFLEPLAVPMADLAAALPYTYFIQSKFFEIDDNLHDLHVPWREIIATLKKHHWKGWLSSEYEGRRPPYRGKDQVRRQHALLNQLLLDTPAAR